MFYWFLESIWRRVKATPCPCPRQLPKKGLYCGTPAHLKPWRRWYLGETWVLLPLESALGSLQIFNPGVEGIFFQRRYYEDCVAPKIP